MEWKGRCLENFSWERNIRERQREEGKAIREKKESFRERKTTEGAPFGELQPKKKEEEENERVRFFWGKNRNRKAEGERKIFTKNIYIYIYSEGKIKNNIFCFWFHCNIFC